MLWLDAHSDFHTFETTQSDNVYGTLVAYFTGRSGLRPHFPELTLPVEPANVCMIGIRSVNTAERAALQETAILVHDMRIPAFNLEAVYVSYWRTTEVDARRLSAPSRRSVANLLGLCGALSDVFDVREIIG